tara:strand:+ start:4938 stop:5417 length:480 start_codon:yes stop_codon:yes gene_type:complete
VKEYIIYKLTRADGKIYIGTTDTERFKNRMYQHKSTERFRDTTFTVEIIKQSTDIAVFREEEQFISEHNSLTPNGLNLTHSGKGCGHDSPHFTTRGYRYSEESRLKMSASAKLRCAKHVRVGWTHSDETKAKWSQMRKGINARLVKGKSLHDVSAEHTI